jgi:hypothetical protein
MMPDEHSRIGVYSGRWKIDIKDGLVQIIDVPANRVLVTSIPAVYDLRDLLKLVLDIPERFEASVEVDLTPKTETRYKRVPVAGPVKNGGANAR